MKPHADAYAPWAVPAARTWLFVLVGGLAVWWSLLALFPSLRGIFFPQTTTATTFWSFFVPDLLLMGLPSIYAIRCLDRDLTQARWATWFVLGGLSYSATWSLSASLHAWEAPLGPMLMLPAAFCQAVVSWTLQPRDAWFRGAMPSSTTARALKTLADAVLFTGVFMLLASLIIRLFEDTYGIPRFDGRLSVQLVGILLVMNLGGLISGLWLVWKGDGTPLPVDTANTLVVEGPYRWVRNPMASLGIAQGLVLGIGIGSWLTFLYAAGGGVFWHMFVRPIEERDLEQRFGEAYRAYQARVPLWVPRPW